MSASREVVQGVKLATQEWHDKLVATGHEPTWRLGPNATKKGYYYWIATCQRCAGTMSVGATSTSSGGSVICIRDVPCSGDAMATEVEDALFSGAVAEAVSRFGQSVYEGIEADVLDSYSEELGWG
jgi:hypothetical protein